MSKSVDGHNELRANLAKYLRLEEDSELFGWVWRCLEEDRDISMWEGGESEPNEIYERAKANLDRARSFPGRTTTGQRRERRVLQDISVEPTQREMDITEAFREYLASHAAQRPVVRKFRREYLPDGLYTDDHDISIVLEEQKVAKAGTDVQQYVDSRRGKPNNWAVPIEFSATPPPDFDPDDPVSNEDQAELRAVEERDEEREMMEEWWGEGKQEENEGAWEPEEDLTEEAMAYEARLKESYEGYFGWYLEELGEWLADKYPWENVGDAVVFLISGRPPRLARPLGATVHEGNATLSITFLPWVSEETILRVYRSLRSWHPRLPGDKTIRVLRFVAEQTDAGGNLPSLSDLLKRWNAANPDDEFSDRSALRRAYRRAVEALVPPYLPLADDAATWYQRLDRLIDR